MRDDEQVINGSVSGPGTVVLFHLENSIDVLEFVIIPLGNSTLQIMESANSAYSASMPLVANQVWSEPGKTFRDDIFLSISAAVTVNFKIRYIYGV